MSSLFWLLSKTDLFLDYGLFIRDCYILFIINSSPFVLSQNFLVSFMVLCYLQKSLNYIMYIKITTKPTLLINSNKNVYLSYEEVKYYRAFVFAFVYCI